MTRKTRLSEDATAAAEAQAAKDAELLAELQAQQSAAEPPTPPTDPDPETTIADKFVGMANLVVEVRKKTRLGEATLAKVMEIALQYHAWDTQMRAQRQPQFPGLFPPAVGDEGTGEDEGLVGPEPHEFLGEAVDDNETPNNVTEVDFTPTPAQE